MVGWSEIYGMSTQTMKSTQRERHVYRAHFCMNSMECVNNVLLQVESLKSMCSIEITQHKTAISRDISILWSITYFECGECVPCRFCVADCFSFSIRIGTIFSLTLY